MFPVDVQAADELDRPQLESVEKLFSLVSATCGLFSRGANVPHFQARFFDRLAQIVRGFRNRMDCEPEETPIMERTAIAGHPPVEIDVSHLREEQIIACHSTLTNRDSCLCLGRARCLISIGLIQML